MLLSIIIFLLSIVPSVLIFILLRNRQKENDLYRKKCTYSFITGVVSVLPIVLLSGILFILNAVLKLAVMKDVNILVYQVIYKFIVLAFAEEIIKFLALRFVLKRKPYAYTWTDVVAFMVIIGTAFGLMEDIPYAFDASPIMMLVRGFTLGHVGYAFIMGWFYGKRLYTGKKRYGVFAVLIPWLIHGLYDFSLTPELMEISDNFAFLGVSLALLDIVLLILMIRFFIRSKKQERYLQPLSSFEQNIG
ncbi:MAG: PrsW family intramembrane metalloprotease [Ruminococcus sp.]|nr:PrsW family intramembrane metalloprotease [Ruminococcus sp.]